ncbi:hypothetical protein B0H17DRAFT_1130374 [Mycena rosella]|uniref:Uncharacterized protein n=1 Tax=Mycena rosella TaxID=1033263 RepID=A0AAD7DRF1_MYCRO|nr:hypothetical protein B0H17DRAFT_1130374 [Mycena rosella]
MLWVASTILDIGGVKGILVGDPDPEEEMADTNESMRGVLFVKGWRNVGITRRTVGKKKAESEDKEKAKVQRAAQNNQGLTPSRTGGSAGTSFGSYAWQSLFSGRLSEQNQQLTPVGSEREMSKSLALKPVDDRDFGGGGRRKKGTLERSRKRSVTRAYNDHYRLHQAEILLEKIKVATDGAPNLCRHGGDQIILPGENGPRTWVSNNRGKLLPQEKVK